GDRNERRAQEAKQRQSEQNLQDREGCAEAAARTRTHRVTCPWTSCQCRPPCLPCDPGLWRRHRSCSCSWFLDTGNHTARPTDREALGIPEDKDRSTGWRGSRAAKSAPAALPPCWDNRPSRFGSW